MPQNSTPPPGCHLCGAIGLRVLPAYAAFARVTSDCKPWPAGGRLGVCPACSAAQAHTDSTWAAEADRIYAGYTIYHQGQGAEQSVFNQATGQAVSRSARLLDRLSRELGLPAHGRLLDIGCGNGALLRAFADRQPGWSLAGVEVADRHRDTIESIPGVERLYVGPPSAAPGPFDVISLVHTLEHIAGPQGFLTALRPQLTPRGHLLVQVPDCEQNPFMLLVADHASHFHLSTLTALVRRAGYEIVAAANDWVAKELTVVACPAVAPADHRGEPEPAAAAEALGRRLDWLGSVAHEARRLAAAGGIGVFGTSIAGTWLFAEVGAGVGFFVDEDPHRVGGRHLERPILAPAQIPAGSEVVVALPPGLADAVARRIRRPDFTLRLPPPLPP